MLSEFSFDIDGKDVDLRLLLDPCFLNLSLEFPDRLHLFLRLHQYETQNPKTPFDTSGIIFAKNLRVFPKPEAADHTLGFILLVGLAALALITIVLVGGFMSRKYGRGSIRLRLHQERRSRKRKIPTPNGNG